MGVQSLSCISADMVAVTSIMAEDRTLLATANVLSGVQSLDYVLCLASEARKDPSRRFRLCRSEAKRKRGEALGQLFSSPHYEIWGSLITCALTLSPASANRHCQAPSVSSWSLARHHLSPPLPPHATPHTHPPLIANLLLPISTHSTTSSSSIHPRRHTETA